MSRGYVSYSKQSTTALFFHFVAVAIVKISSLTIHHMNYSFWLERGHYNVYCCSSGNC